MYHPQLFFCGSMYRDVSARMRKYHGAMTFLHGYGFGCVNDVVGDWCRHESKQVGDFADSGDGAYRSSGLMTHVEDVQRQVCLYRWVVVRGAGGIASKNWPTVGDLETSVVS